jgi:hypothetical protein
MADGDNESVVPILEVEAIYEIGSLYSLSLTNGQAILIPKQHEATGGDTATMLQELAEQQGIPYIQELNWKWK